MNRKEKIYLTEAFARERAKDFDGAHDWWHVLRVRNVADRLDAIGAIGIARAFNYGGFRNNPIYIPGDRVAVKNQSIDHFYDKLLLLKDLMNTSTAKFLAEERHEFLEKFLEQFYKEWNFSL
jgi:uncharacterized protein